MEKNTYQNNNILYLITGLYCLALILFLAVWGYTPTNDGDGYIEFAQICIKNKQLYPCMALIQGHPFIWNIGSINLTALSLLLFNSLYPLLVLLCIMKAITAFLIGKISQKLFSDRITIIAISIFALYPNNWGQSTTILSEIPMICLSLCAFYIAIAKEKVFYLFVAGLIFGLANWFRPVAIVYMGTLILYYIFFINKKWIKKSFSLCSGYILFIGIVGLECYHRTGFFLYQAESLWFNMAESTYEPSVAPQYGTNPYPKGTIRYIENMDKKSAIECNEIWKQRSIEWLKQHPFKYLKKIPGRLMYMYYNDMDNIIAFSRVKEKAEDNYVTLPYKNILQRFTSLSAVQYIAIINLVYYWLLIIFSIHGGYFLIKKHEYKKAFLPIMIIIGGSLSLVLAIHGETRFKAPFMPFIFILAAVYITSWLYKNKSHEYNY